MLSKLSFNLFLSPQTSALKTVHAPCTTSYPSRSVLLSESIQWPVSPSSMFPFSYRLSFIVYHLEKSAGALFSLLLCVVPCAATGRNLVLSQVNSQSNFLYCHNVKNRSCVFCGLTPRAVGTAVHLVLKCNAKVRILFHTCKFLAHIYLTFARATHNLLKHRYL